MKSEKIKNIIEFIHRITKGVFSALKIWLKTVLIPFLLLCLPFLASGVILTIIQPPFDLGWLAWVAIVPFILACSPGAKLRQLVLAAYLVSTCYWLGNLYWIAPVTWPGWLVFCLYTALLWPLVVFTVRFCRAKKIPLFLAVPVIFVGVEQLQGLFLGGFFWRHLSHSQYANITLIQIADIFGAGGVSFLVAMVNGLIAEFIIAIREKRVFKISLLLKTALVCAAVVGSIVYGRWRIGQSDEFIEAGPLVGSVQSNIPQSVKESFEAEEAILAELLEYSSAAVKSGAKLVVWPETMVQAILDERVLKLLAPSNVHRVFNEKLRAHSKDKAFVLVGAYGGEPEILEDGKINLLGRFNSAFLYGPDGEQARQSYNKIHLVPFGEVVPFKKSAPWLYKILMKFTPYDYDYSLEAGDEFTVFEMISGPETSEQIYKFGVMICYEDTVPVIARRFAVDAAGQKRLDWLVNISNDGWFVRYKNQKVLPSTELGQHTATCVFRAVENRLAVVRSVNTGISCIIDSVGRIRNSYAASSEGFSVKAMERQGMGGWFVDRMPIDKRRTFFTKYGQWLDFCCVMGVFLLAIAAIVKLKRPKG